jgi:hypothetical protein
MIGFIACSSNVTALNHIVLGTAQDHDEANARALASTKPTPHELFGNTLPPVLRQHSDGAHADTLVDAGYAERAECHVANDHFHTQPNDRNGEATGNPRGIHLASFTRRGKRSHVHGMNSGEVCR